MVDKAPILYIVAGEPSGDALGARLIRALKAATDGKVRIEGVGGPLMNAEGLNSQFPMAELSVMGLLEVLPHARRIMGRMREAAEAVDRLQPDAVVTIDSPGFAHGFVTRIRSGAIKKIHYVAPTVWAWRKNRVHKFKRHFDHLLCLLPFEPEYFRAVGLDATFVGHSVIESAIEDADSAAFRRRWSLPPEGPLLAVLPGSRKGEVTRHIDPFREAVTQLLPKHPGLTCVMPTVPHLENLLADLTRSWPTNLITVSEEADRHAAMKTADAALAASGTVSLELALAETPMVIAYKLNALTHWIVRRMVSVDHASLLNIMADRAGQPAIIPERLQADCRPATLAGDLENLLGPEGREQVRALKPWLKALKPASGLPPSEEAARAVLRAIGHVPPTGD